MGLSHSPSIPMNGLVFNVDFANIKSTNTANQFTRTNLIANPSFETNNTGWSGAQVNQTVRTSSTGYATTYSRTNLIINPNFETNTTGWSATNSSTLATTTSYQLSGASSALSTSSSSDYNGMQLTTRVAVSPSTRYALSAYCRNVSGDTRTVYIGVQWYTAAGVYISEINSASQGTLSTAAGWVRRSCSGLSPATAASANIFMLNGTTGLTAGWQTAFDAVLFEQYLALRPFFDGTYADTWTGRTVTTSQAWTGTANASTSTITHVYTNSLNIPAYSGSNFGAILMSNTGDSNITTGTGSQQYEIGNYNTSMYFYVPTGSTIAGRTVTLSLEGGTATTTSISSSPATLVAGQWVRASRSWAVTGAGTTTVVGRLSGTLSTSLDEPIYVDGALIEKTAGLRPYFDGSTTEAWSGYTQVGSASWTGSAHASTSQTTWTGLAYTYDLSTGGIIGELVGPTFSSNNKGTLGFVTDDLIVFPNSTALDLQSLTIEVWVKLNSIDQNAFLFEKGTLNSQYSLFFDNAGTGRINLRYFNSANSTVTDLTVNTVGLFDTTSWNQVVGTITLSGGTGTRQLFVNSSTQRYKTSGAITGAIATNAGGMSIGAHGGYAGTKGYYLDGSIALVRVYNRVLTDDEIDQNFAATAGRFGL